MKRFKVVLTAAVLSLATLTACGEQVQDVTDKAGEVTGDVADKAGDVTGAVTDKAGEVTGAVTDGVEGATDKVGELTGLAGGIPAFTESANGALTAVKSGDFGAAQAEVTKLQDAWGSISEQVQEKSPDVHAKIEEGISSVTSGLASDTPDEGQLTTAITDMVASIKDIKL